MSKALSTLSAGDKIKLNEWGIAKPYVVGAHSHHAAGRTTLFRDKLYDIGLFPWNTYIANIYTNCYAGSILDNVIEKFVNILDDGIQALIKPVPISVMRGFDTVVSPVVTIPRRAFALSCTEIGAAAVATEGSLLDYFNTYSGSSYKIAYNESAVATSWWLRSPHQDYRYYARCIQSGGSVGVVACGTLCGVRPALTLPSTLLCSDSVDADGCYVPVVPPVPAVYIKAGGVWTKAI